MQRFFITFLFPVFFFKLQAQQVIIFNDSLNAAPTGWWVRNASTHDWKWYADQGRNGSGGFRMKLPDVNNLIATPLVTLQAGKTYTFSFKTRTEKTDSKRRIGVYYNQNQTLIGATKFFETFTVPNSYETPVFVESNPSFSVPASGQYRIILDYQELGYLFTFLDEVAIEETILPTTVVTSPASNAVFNENGDLTLTANAADQDGSVTKVEFFVNGIEVGEDLTAPYTYLMKNVVPGDYTITTRATDNRGNVGNSAPIQFRMNFRDGSFGKYIQWNFDRSISNQFDYWTLKNGDFKTRTGWRGTPCLEIFSAYANCHAVSPGVFLKAGQTYKLELVGDNSNSVAPRFLINTEQTLGGTLIDTMRITDNDNFSVIRNKTFTVPNDNTYFLVINYPVVANFTQLKFDNVRLIGDLENPPLSKLTYPAKTEKVAVNSTVKLTADFVKQDTDIQRVAYYTNGILLGEATTAPFDYLWQNVPEGNFSVSARPYDINNRFGASTQNLIEVKPNDFKASSLFGSAKNDDIRAAAFQPDGTIILAGNIGQRNDFKNILLNNSTDTTMGCVIRLSTDGKSILSITRLAEKLYDMALDSAGNIYVGGKNGTQGIGFKLNPQANEITWQKDFPKFVHRLDASVSGRSVFLTSSTSNFNQTTITDVTTIGCLPNGQEFMNRSGASQYSSDVVINDSTSTIVLVGYKNFNTFDSPTGTQTLPVYVPVIRAFDYAGTQKYVGYDWGSDRTQPNWLNLAANNMADVRTSRAAMGKDGKLYVTFEVFGGNHILRYSPFNNTTPVPIVGGDNYFNFSNTGTETKVFVGRYDVGTGNYILGQQLTNRLVTPPYRGNTIFSRNGAIAADEEGRVYLTGKAASGSPLTVDHQPGEYSGGAMMYVLSPNMANREMCVRLTINGDARALAVQNKNRWLFAGDTDRNFYATQPVQATSNGSYDAFWAVVDNAPCSKNYVLGRNSYSTESSFVVNQKINSEALVPTNQRLIYDAKQSIELKPGFVANQGSIFTAKIGGCL